MDSKINYIRNLVYLGQADNDFHEKEMEFVKKVGERLGLSQNEIEKELNSKIDERPPLPTEEILGFILLDDLMNLMASDGRIMNEEIDACKKIAKELGFESEMIVSISEKIKKHIMEGFAENATQILIKNELFKSTTKNYYHEKYS
ncbi:MAG: hypothetical protein J5I50_00010 [Chitinophagaceae bacterium]|nr:hypothetical protein [Chitinophagaceae bacterium]